MSVCTHPVLQPSKVSYIQVADASFLTWAAGRLSGVTTLQVLPCQSARDRVAQLSLTAGPFLLSTLVMPKGPHSHVQYVANPMTGL